MWKIYTLSYHSKWFWNGIKTLNTIICNDLDNSMRIIHKTYDELGTNHKRHVRPNTVQYAVLLFHAGPLIRHSHTTSMICSCFHLSKDRCHSMQTSLTYCKKLHRPKMGRILKLPSIPNIESTLPRKLPLTKVVDS